jgi:hypothetical protein
VTLSPRFSARSANTAYRRAGLLDAVLSMGRHEPGDLTAMLGNHDLLAALGEIEQLTKLVFRLKGADFAHNDRPFNPTGCHLA